MSGLHSNRNNIIIYSIYAAEFIFLSIFSFINGLWILGLVCIPFILFCLFVDFIFISTVVSQRRKL